MSGAATATFVVVVLAIVVAIVVAAPQHADPSTIARGADASLAPGESLGPTLSSATEEGDDFATGDVNGPRSRPPERLRGYRWPMDGGRLTGYYDYRSTGFLAIGGRRIHEGIDIASFCGDRVVAAHAGKVLAAGRDFARHTGFDGSLEPFYRRLERRHEMGSLPIAVVVDDGNGYRSVYAHLEETTVKPGQRVKAGELVGRQGQTGNATGCHLHYELVRMDGPWMRVAKERVERERYPAWVRERVDPLRVLPIDSKRAPRQVPGVKRPTDPPSVSD